MGRSSGAVAEGATGDPRPTGVLFHRGASSPAIGSCPRFFIEGGLMERLRQVAAVTHPVAVSADVHDVAAVEPIQKRRRHHPGPEDRSPLFEPLVGSRHRGRQAGTRSVGRKRLSSSRRAVSASCRFLRCGPTWGDSEATMASAGLPVVSPSRMRRPLTPNISESTPPIRMPLASRPCGSGSAGGYWPQRVVGAGG